MGPNGNCNASVHRAILPLVSTLIPNPHLAIPSLPNFDRAIPMFRRLSRLLLAVPELFQTN
jgi:hypothetical protein